MANELATIPDKTAIDLSRQVANGFTAVARLPGIEAKNRLPNL